MLTRDDLVEIVERYHDSEYADWPKEQAVFDIGRLLGHADDLSRQVTAHQASLDGVMGQYAEQRDRRIVAEQRVGWLEDELAAAEMAGDALEGSLREMTAERNALAARLADVTAELADAHAVIADDRAAREG